MPDFPNLSRKQSVIVETLNRPVLISAGAGSGKTAIAVRRFLRILEYGRAGIEDILVAVPSGGTLQEFKTVIRQAVLTDASGIRVADMDKAQVFTVSGLCRKIVRENVVDAGVNPRFKVIGYAGRRTILNTLVDSALQVQSAESDIWNLVDALGDETIRRVILAIVQAQSIESPVGVDPMPYLEAFERCFNEYMALVGDLPQGKMAELLHNDMLGYPRAMESAHLLAAGQGDECIDWESFYNLRRYRRRLRAPRTSSYALKQQVRTTRATLDDFIAACLDRQSARQSGIISRLAGAVAERYSSSKSADSLLDNDDLLEISLKLLYNEDGKLGDTALRYRKKYKHAILCDLHDIGPREQRVLDAVCRPDGLLAIQDERQSILSFMHGGVDPVASRKDTVGSHRTKEIALTEAYRSRPGITWFINHFFGHVWGEDRIGYEHLISAGSFVDKQDPDVEIRLLPRIQGTPNDPELAEMRAEQEAEAIAERILHITGSSPLLLTGAGREGRAAVLGDIAVLFRSSAHIPIYARVLERYGIETCQLSGREFGQSPEIRSILALLEVLRNPSNDIEMLTVLISPLVGVTEETVLQLCENEMPSAESGRLYTAIRWLEGTDLPESEKVKLYAFNDLLSDLMRLSNHQPVDILNAVLETTNYDLKVLALEGGLRRYENVKRLQEIVNSFQAKSGNALNEFTTRISDMARLPDIPASEHPNAVRLMTIHRAKCMQFPVVFVAQISRGLYHQDDSWLFDRDCGLSLLVRDPKSQQMRTPLTFQELSERIRNRTADEEKRALYVAMTRAEEHLILIGASDLRGDYSSTYRDAGSWTGWLEKAFGLMGETPNADLQVEGCRFRYRYGPLEKRSSTVPRIPSQIVSRILTLREERPSYSSHIDRAKEILKRGLGESDGRPIPKLRISVTGVLDYLDCPARYRFTHLLGMPEASPNRSGIHEEELGGASLGHLVHELLEGIDFGEDIEGQLPNLLSRIPDQKHRAQVKPILDRFAAGRWRREMAVSNRIMKEVPFEVPVAGKALAGRIDVLFRGHDGWVILDYKTGQAETRERYELQVGIYAYVIHKLLGEMPANAALLLLSLDDEWVGDTSDGVAARFAEQKMREVIEAVDTGSFVPSPGKSCEWCSYSKLCPRI